MYGFSHVITLDVTNILVILIPACFMFWMLNSLYRLSSLTELHSSLSHHNLVDYEAYGAFQSHSNARQAPESPAAAPPEDPEDDTQSIDNAREFFDALLRFRQTKLHPPDRVQTLSIPFELHKDSLSLHTASVAATCSSSSPSPSEPLPAPAPDAPRLITGLQFDLSVSRSASVRLFWSVSPARLSRLLHLPSPNPDDSTGGDPSSSPLATESDEDGEPDALLSKLSQACSLAYYFDHGPAESTRHAFQLDAADLPPQELQEALLPSSDPNLALVVVVSDPSSPSHRLFVTCRILQNSLSMADQYYQCPGGVYQVGEIYGTNDKETECSVCMSEARDVVLLPCGHFCVGKRCLGKLTQCPLCRTTIRSYLQGISRQIPNVSATEDISNTLILDMDTP